MSTTDKPGITEQLRRQVAQLDLQDKAERLAEATLKASHQAVQKAGELAHENRHKVQGVLDQAGNAIDQRTHGKYSGAVAKAKSQVTRGVDKLAQQRPAAPQPDVSPDAPPFMQPDVSPDTRPGIQDSVPPRDDSGNDTYR